MAQLRRMIALGPLKIYYTWQQINLPQHVQTGKNQGQSQLADSCTCATHPVVGIFAICIEYIFSMYRKKVIGERCGKSEFNSLTHHLSHFYIDTYSH